MKTPETPLSKVLPIFEKHLFNILPLWAPSDSGKNNQVVQYCQNELKRMGRAYTVDEHNNIVVHPSTLSHDGKLKGVVAHTDVVTGIAKNKPGHRQAIRYDKGLNIAYNQSGLFPMGGDDKVGVAFVLAMMEYRQDYQGILVSDEEIGCIGSGKLSKDICQYMDFAIQLDRKGWNDIVFSIGGTNICSLLTAKYIMGLVPHREPVGGGSTDVKVLVTRGLAGSAMNMSCGYYAPHGEDEYLRMGHVHHAVSDALTILYGLEGNMMTPARSNETGLSIKSTIVAYDPSKIHNAMPTGTTVEDMYQDDEWARFMGSRYPGAVPPKSEATTKEKTEVVATSSSDVSNKKTPDPKVRKTVIEGIIKGLSDPTIALDESLLNASIIEISGDKDNTGRLHPVRAVKSTNCRCCSQSQSKDAIMYLVAGGAVCFLCGITFTHKELLEQIEETAKC